MEDYAEGFAVMAHGSQLYDGKAYVHHLRMVVDITKAFTDEQHLISAAWLHDVIEDTKVEYFELAREFGSPTANIVWACTGVGKNRKARQASIAAKLAVYPGAPLVKTADRIANLEYGLSTGNFSKWAMYMKEQSAFINHVEDYVPPEMIERLRATREVGLAQYKNDMLLHGSYLG